MRILLVLLSMSFGVFAQRAEINPEAQNRALKMVEQMDTSITNSIWPNVDKNNFVVNLKKNIENPLYIYQGKPTYFCGYAALTHYLVLTDPEKYVRIMVELYQNGSSEVSDRTLGSSKEIREAAGILSGKGKMDINHADQLWFLVLADNYKGYLNWFNTTYELGDEDNFWSSTNFSKFNNMLRSLIDADVKARGTDLIRPIFLNSYDFIKDKANEHTIILYLNNKMLYPTKFFKLIPPTPTHFVMLYNISLEKKFISLDYWDYGLRTNIKIKKRKFRKMIYGITYLKTP